MLITTCLNNIKKGTYAKCFNNNYTPMNLSLVIEMTWINYKRKVAKTIESSTPSKA